MGDYSPRSETTREDARFEPHQTGVMYKGIKVKGARVSSEQRTREHLLTYDIVPLGSRITLSRRPHIANRRRAVHERILFRYVPAIRGGRQRSATDVE